MPKQIVSGLDAKNKLKIGVDKLANAVRSTLGPKGRNVAIERRFGDVYVTKDGVTVAKEVELADPVENMGATMIKQVAIKTGDVAGDGTTTATVLAQAIITEGLKLVAAGANPMDLKKGIDRAVVEVVKYLVETTEDVGDNLERIRQIATVSANGDEFIGDRIAEAILKVGKQGLITVEESSGTDTTIKVVEGMEFDRGWLSPYFVTNVDSMVAEYEKPFILITDRKIAEIQPMIPFLQMVMEQERAFLVIAEEVTGEFMATMVTNRIQRKVPVVCVKAPGFGQLRKDMLEDIAILTGGTVISDSVGEKWENVKLEMLGKCDKIVVSKDATQIINGRGAAEPLKLRINMLRRQLEAVTNDRDREDMADRIAKLTSGVAIVQVGGVTEAEMKEKKDRIEDALMAVKAAIDEGIVPGGGLAYIRAIERLSQVPYRNDDEKSGIAIISRILEAPLRQMISNGGDEPAEIIATLRKSNDKEMGYNVRNGVYEYLLNVGIVDPTKVARIAIESAASVSTLFLTMENIIHEVKVSDDNQPLPPGIH